MKKRLFGFLKKINKLKPKTWFILAFAFLCILQVALYPKMLTSNYLYAEDGGVFVSEYVRDGSKTIFKPFAGYLVITSRLFSAAAVTAAKVTNNFNFTCYTIEALSVLFIAFVGAYFVSDRFKFLIKSRLARLLTMIIIYLLVGEFFGMFLCSVGIHWWCGLLIFLVSLELLAGKLPSKFIYPLIIISILSSPSSLILGFSLIHLFLKAFFIDKKPKSLLKRETFIFLLIAVIPLLIQAYFMLFRTEVSTISSGISASHVLETVRSSYNSTLSAPIIPFSMSVFYQLASSNLAPIIGVMIWVVLIIFSKKQKLLKYVIFSIICSVFIYIMTYYKNAAPLDLYLIMTNYPMFYHTLPAISSLILIVSVWQNFKTKRHFAIITAAILLAVVPNLRIDRWKPDLWKNQAMNEANQYLDFSSRTAAKIHVAPYAEEAWYDYVLIPVNTEYCQKEKVICEKL